MAFLTTEEIQQAVENYDDLTAAELFALEVELGMTVPPQGKGGWHVFYPAVTIPRGQLDRLATRIVGQEDHDYQVEIADEPAPFLVTWFRHNYSINPPPLIFKVR